MEEVGGNHGEESRGKRMKGRRDKMMNERREEQEKYK